MRQFPLVNHTLPLNTTLNLLSTMKICKVSTCSRDCYEPANGKINPRCRVHYTSYNLKVKLKAEIRRRDLRKVDQERILDQERKCGRDRMAKSISHFVNRERGDTEDRLGTVRDDENVSPAQDVHYHRQRDR